MADVKISGLPASTVPLAGTEVLPIVQGGATKQVSITNLTTGRNVPATSFSALNGSGAAPAYSFVNSTNTGFTWDGFSIGIINKGNAIGFFGGSGIGLFANASYTFNAGTGPFIFGDTTSTVALRNGANAQTFNVYNTYTSNTNYENHTITWASNVCYSKNIVGASGTLRLYVPVTGATTVAALPSAATAGIGARSMVTDALAPSFGVAVAGSGAVTIPVYSDGTSWLVG